MCICSKKRDHLDLFQQAIEMSGSYYSERTTSDRVVVETTELASFMGCEAADAKELKKCLKTKTPEEFMNAATKVLVIDITALSKPSIS